MIIIQRQPFVFECHFNADIIKSNYGNDIRYCHDMFQLFLETIPRDLFFLKNAIKTRNLLDIFQIAQRIKSNFYWIGLDDCANSLEKLANFARFKEESSTLDLGVQVIQNIDAKISAVKQESERMNNYLSRA